MQEYGFYIAGINTPKSLSIIIITSFGEKQRRKNNFRAVFHFPTLPERKKTLLELFRFWVEHPQKKMDNLRHVSHLFCCCFFMFCIARQWAWSFATTWRVLNREPSAEVVVGGLGPYEPPPRPRLVPPTHSASCSQSGLFLALASVRRLLNFRDSLQSARLCHSAHTDKKIKKIEENASCQTGIILDTKQTNKTRIHFFHFHYRHLRISLSWYRKTMLPKLLLNRYTCLFETIKDFL